MLIWGILFSIPFEFFFFLDASLNNIFVDWIDLTCHGTFISCNFVCLNKNTIGWDFHTFVDLNNVSYKNEVLVNFNRFSISDNRDPFSFIDDRVELNELSFFLVIVDWSYSGWYGDCDQDSEALNPSGWSMIIICSSNFNCDRDNTGHNKDSQGKVLKCLTEELKKPWGFFD